jgi:hypothetical protein
MRTSSLVANICSVSLAGLFARFNGLVDSMVSCVQLSTLHNEMETRGGAIAVMYVRGVRIYAHWYFCVVPTPVCVIYANCFVSVLFFDSE